MHAPKVTFYALVAIATWDSLATLAQAYEPPPERPDADIDPSEKPKPVATIEAAPSPETTQRRAFSPAGSGTALASLPRIPSLVEMKDQLIAQFSPSRKSLENHPVFIWIQNRQSTTQVPFQAAEPSASSLPDIPGESGAQPVSAPEPTAGTPEPVAVPKAATTGSPEAAPVLFNANAAEATSLLALRMAESGQVDRARWMAESLPPEQRSEVLAKIEASVPPAPLTSDATPSDPPSSAPDSSAEPNPAVSSSPTAAEVESTQTLALAPSVAAKEPVAEKPADAVQIAVIPPETSSIGTSIGAEFTQTLPPPPPVSGGEPIAEKPPDAVQIAVIPHTESFIETSREAESTQTLPLNPPVSGGEPVAEKPPDAVALAVIPPTTTLQEPAAVDLKSLPSRGTPAVVPDLPDSSELLAYARPTPTQSASGMIYPLASEVPITSPFGWRIHPISGQRRFHAGTDFGAAEGTPVVAVLPGRVTKASWQGGYGLAIEIEHKDGTVDSFYAHLSQALVQEGAWVEQGTVIGHVGSTGHTTGPHLHFEVRRNTAEGWTEVDPMAELGPASPVAAPAAPEQPTGEPLAQLPAPKIAARLIAAPASSTGPVPDYSVANLADLKVSVVPVSYSAGTKEISTPTQPPTTQTAPNLPQSQLPGLPTLSPSQMPSLPGTPVSTTQVSAQDRFNSLDIKDYGYWSDLCRSLVASGQFSDALAACDRTLALKSDALEPWLYRGQALEGLGQYTEAIANYGYVLHREPKHAESFTYQCRAFLKLGNADAALEACDQALASGRFWGQAAPAMAWHLRGQVLTQKDQPQEALKAYERALRTEGERSEYLLDRCRALLDLGRYEDVINACDEALAIDQNWGERSPAQALQMQGRALAKLGKTGDAIAAFDQALARDLKNADIWTDQGQLLYSLGRYSDALNSFQQATQLKPNASQALAGQAAALNELKQYEPALQAINQALQGDGVWGDLNPSFIWDQRALALGGLGQYDEALAAANRATGLQPDYAKAWNNRAVVLWHLEQYDEALASTKKALELDASYAQAWFNQGRIYSNTQQYQQALNAYDEVLRLNPNSEMANLWINRAAVLWHLDRGDETLAALDKAIQIDPKSTQAFVNKGIVLLELKRFEAAIAAYDQALEVDPQANAAWYGRGTALRKLNREEEATAAFAHVSS